ncbi:vWA domain-containing protein [Okeania sp. SIO2B3]|uniref:vWA domain-containing protein n=1 Tax=Okeania sp. SIO2B3 TaxID=2607784 RepID=UPI0013C1DC44|nr:vWA domain-containing protein [Okeania sp. SIO2B3]NET43464.1 VWA domain-containing protein [Okeania sp. SIO2B3]
MTDFSILKHSAICLLSLTVTWQPSIAAETLKIVKSYDENNTEHQVEAVIEFKVLDEKNRLKEGLNKKDIELKSNGELVDDFILIKPDEKKPDPSNIIILLDVTGSMNQLDRNNQIRGLAAIAAIRSFIKDIDQKEYPSKISLVPFAEDGKNCGGGYVPPPVNDGALSKFYSPEAPELQKELSDLENRFKSKNKKPCGSTNIRQPLGTAIRYLNENYSKKEAGSQEPSRLGIILVSDGFDSVLSQNKSELNDLEKLIKDSPEITIHTLGYGYSQGSKYDEIDPEVLEKLAQASEGIYLFSANSTEISQALEIFLVSLLGEYEIRYQPTSIKQYEKETVKITVGELSAEENFRINNIPSLPFITRMLILGGTLIFCTIFGLLPFIGWRWYIEQKSTPANE